MIYIFFLLAQTASDIRVLLALSYGSCSGCLRLTLRLDGVYVSEKVNVVVSEE